MYAYTQCFVKKFLTFIKTLPDQIIQLIWVPCCFACKNPRWYTDPLCTSCTESIQPIVTTHTKAHGYTITIHAASAYQEPIDLLIRAKIWKNAHTATALAQLIWHHSSVKHIPFDAILWVPNHWTRTLTRGYEVPYIMAQHLAKQSGKPTIHAVRKIRKTPFQSLANATKRATQQNNCFQPTKHAQNLTGKTILIVDDAYTTGHTIKQFIKAIHHTKPKAIYIAVACRTL